LFVLGFGLNWYGAAQCNWNEILKDRMLKSTRQIPYEGKNVYLDTKTYLFGCENAIPTEKPSGHHKYDFSCRLSSSLPASVSCKYGHIIYYLQGFLDIPWNSDKAFRMKFRVVRKENLNYQPELKLPFKKRESKTFYFFPFETDPLTMTVSLSQTGYVPGEKIHVIVNYINESSVHVQQTIFMLRRIVKCHR
jgi:Arrestin (or S-antigen), N-terminal domain